MPFPAGGGADVSARMVAQVASEGWGQPVIIQNKAGATGAIGSEYVARATPDGYTLLLATGSTHAVLPAYRTDLPYDTVTSFAPATLVAIIPNMLVVNPKKVPVVDHCRAHQVPQGQSRKGQLRELRSRQLHPFRRRAVQADDADEHDACRLPRQRACAQRSAGGERRSHLRQHAGGVAAGAAGQSAGIGSGEPPAYGAGAGRARDRRDLAGIRGGVLGRDRRAGRDAAARSWRRFRRHSGPPCRAPTSEPDSASLPMCRPATRRRSSRSSSATTVRNGSASRARPTSRRNDRSHPSQ